MGGYIPEMFELEAPSHACEFSNSLAYKEKKNKCLNFKKITQKEQKGMKIMMFCFVVAFDAFGGCCGGKKQ